MLETAVVQVPPSVLDEVPHGAEHLTLDHGTSVHLEKTVDDELLKVSKVG